MRLSELRRNDVDGALRFAMRAMDAGEYTPEAARVLMRLQDDPAELERRFWGVIEVRRAIGAPLPDFLQK